MHLPCKMTPLQIVRDALTHIWELPSTGAVFRNHRNPWRIPVTAIGHGAIAELVTDSGQRSFERGSSLENRAQRKNVWTCNLKKVHCCPVVHCCFSWHCMFALMTGFHQMFSSFHCLFCCKNGEPLDAFRFFQILFYRRTFAGQTTLAWGHRFQGERLQFLIWCERLGRVADAKQIAFLLLSSLARLDCRGIRFVESRKPWQHGI